MSTDSRLFRLSVRALPLRLQALAILVFALAGVAILWIAKSHPTGQPGGAETASTQSKHAPGLFYPTSAQWAKLTVEPIQQRVFRSEHVTEGKIAVDEDRLTPIFSPYAGRVIKLFVKPGDTVILGQPLFTVEATDMVQAQNDFIAAATALNKARSALQLAQIVDKRQRLLYDGKAVPLKEVQQARVALDAADNDARSSEVALEAARNRLRLLGKTDQEIAEFEDSGKIDPATLIHAPIAGTIVQRKIGPGQYVGSGANDPVFIVGDLSTVWLAAYVRETEAPLVHIGQALYFTVLSYPDQVFPANISYVAPALESTRRLLVRATVNNAAGLLKPEMFASVKILTGEGDNGIALPRAAVIYATAGPHVWVVRDNDKAIELRRVKLGVINGDMVEVLEGLALNERVITQGSLYIDRVALASS